MIQAIGLTSAPRRNQPPAVHDLTFEACPGRVTVLLGPGGAGKSTALRLQLELTPGRGVALFRGRPLHRIPHPCREVGVLLGDVPGHPRRTARCHLRMLAAATGVPARRADDLLDVVGLGRLAHQRLAGYSLGMGRRLGLAAALLGDPHTLVLDEPTRGLSPRGAAWLGGLLRGYADEGGTVLLTSRDPQEAARLADRVVTMEAGRLFADQEAADFARTRLRSRVTLCSPQAERLAALLSEQSRTTAAHRDAQPVLVVREGRGRISVYGSTCAAIGETAHRHRIPVHQLTDDVRDTGGQAPEIRLPVSPSHPPAHRADRLPAPPRKAPASPAALGSRPSAPGTSCMPSSGCPEPVSARPVAPVSRSVAPGVMGRAASSAPTAPSRNAVRPARVTPVAPGGRPTASGSSSVTASSRPVTRSGRLVAPAGRPGPPGGMGRTAPSPSRGPARPPRITVVAPAGPVRPFRYELRRFAGARSSRLVPAAALLAALAAAVVLAGSGRPPALRTLSGWPASLPLPPAALAAGLLGAIASGQEFRYPALAPARAPVPRRLKLLIAKLAVTGAVALLLCAATAAVNATALALLHGSPFHGTFLHGTPPRLPTGWPGPAAGLAALTVGCAWVGVLAAAALRSTVAGLAVALGMPMLGTPVLWELLSGPVERSLEALPEWLSSAAAVLWPSGPVPWPSDPAPWLSEADQWLSVALRFTAQPGGQVLLLVLGVLLGVLLRTYRPAALRREEP